MHVWKYCTIGDLVLVINELFWQIVRIYLCTLKVGGPRPHPGALDIRTFESTPFKDKHPCRHINNPGGKVLFADALAVDQLDFLHVSKEKSVVSTRTLHPTIAIVMSFDGLQISKEGKGDGSYLCCSHQHAKRHQNSNPS